MEDIIEANFTEISETPQGAPNTEVAVATETEVAKGPEVAITSYAFTMSVIIPAYNCRAEIERLLDSIVIQNWPKEYLEVIICEDRNSTDNFMELVTPYYDKLNIQHYFTEERDIHCPGNTRKDGLSHATGQWVTFIDNDDAFEAGAFDMIERTIVSTGCSDMVFTIFHEYIDDKWVDKSQDPNATGGYGREFDGQTWLHGNWYNRQWLIDNNIDFKENLESHEDLYFNSLCNAALLSQNRNYTIPQENAVPGPNGRQYAYIWIFRPNSLSRGYFRTDHFYIEVYLNDYVYSATAPWMHSYSVYCTPSPEDTAEIAQFKANLAEFFIQQCVLTLLYTYCYWEASYYRLKDNVLPHNIDMIRDAVDQICFRFKITRTEIINRIYSRPELYMKIKQESFSGGGMFVECHTFGDFILGL